MSEFAVARQFAEAVLAACNALETAAAAEERARLANIAAANANNAKRQAEMAAAQAKAEADRHVADSKAFLERVGAEEKGKLAAEKADHDRYVANAKAQVETASATLTALQADIAEARMIRDTINAENAKLLAAFGEAGKKLAHG